MERSRKRCPAVGIVCVCAALLSPGCGEDDSPASNAAAALNTVVIDGSSTVFQISKAAQVAYAKVQPKTEVIVDTHGTAGGFARYFQGEVDVVNASREATAEEESTAKQRGIDWIRFLVAHDGVTFVVSKKNEFCKSLTLDQLRELWAADSKVQSWKDLNPAWPDRKIRFFSPDAQSGTTDFVAETLFGKGKLPRKDSQTSPDDNVLVKGIAENPDALGFFGFAYYKANESIVRSLAIQTNEDARPVSPTAQSILDESYEPLSRPLYIYVKKSSIRRPAVSAFVRFYLENLTELVESAHSVAPTADELATNRIALPSVSGGLRAEDLPPKKPAKPTSE